MKRIRSVGLAVALLVAACNLPGPGYLPGPVEPGRVVVAVRIARLDAEGNPSPGRYWGGSRVQI